LFQNLFTKNFPSVHKYGIFFVSKRKKVPFDVRLMSEIVGFFLKLSNCKKINHVFRGSRQQKSRNFGGLFFDKGISWNENCV